MPCVDGWKWHRFQLRHSVSDSVRRSSVSSQLDSLSSRIKTLFRLLCILSLSIGACSLVLDWIRMVYYGSKHTDSYHDSLMRCLIVRFSHFYRLFKQRNIKIDKILIFVTLCSMTSIESRAVCLFLLISSLSPWFDFISSDVYIYSQSLVPPKSFEINGPCVVRSSHFALQYRCDANMPVIKRYWFSSRHFDWLFSLCFS